MADKSSYLRFLPPVLWEGEPPAPAFSLGGALRIFEKILTGIDDNEIVLHNGHRHESIEAAIARVHHLFDPWSTPPEFLDWLASWVGLEFSHLWDEYQRRKITADIISVYKQRGRKEGLNQYLDLYTVADKRPRVVVDNGSKVLYTRPLTGQSSSLITLVSQGPSIKGAVLSHEGLMHPLCITTAPDRSLIVGDNGTPLGFVPVVPKGVWLLPPPGRYAFSGAPPKPQRVGPVTFSPRFPVGVVADKAAPWNLFVLDNSITLGAGGAALYQLTSPGFATATTLATNATLGTVWPVAMALDLNGHLLILDRGVPVPSGLAAAPKLIDVQLAPFTVTSTVLTQVLEPLSLLVMPNGDVLIGDGRQQNSTVPADIVRLDRVAATETRLLTGVAAAANPLAAPTGLARRADDADGVYVLDLGLKPYASSLDPLLATDPYRRHIAEPAAIYRVDLSAAPPVITRSSDTRQLVFPTGMVYDDDTLYVADRGEYSDPSISGPMMRVWRASPYEFGVVIHFSEQHPTTQLQRRQIVQDVHEIVAREKPVQADFTMVYSV